MYHIYSIESHETPETYVGITRHPELTLYYHETCSEYCSSNLYTFIRSHGGWKNFFMRHVSTHETYEDAKNKKLFGSLNEDMMNVPTIYKIFCRDPSIPQVYVGQTINFECRRFSHMMSLEFYKSSIKLYEFMRTHGGWSNWYMIPVRQYPLETSKQTLDRLEWYWWKTLGGALNSVVPGSHRSKWKGSDEEFEESVCLSLNLEKFSIKEISLDI
jgi:phage-related protein